jgi:hypothetical protein
MMQANPFARVVSDMFMLLEFRCPFQTMGIESQVELLKLSNKVLGNGLLDVCPKSGKHVAGNRPELNLTNESIVIFRDKFTGEELICS